MDEFINELVKDAMGRLFWPLERAMATDCCAIVLALEGQNQLLRELFGSNEPPKPAELPPLTPDALRGMFWKAA